MCIRTSVPGSWTFRQSKHERGRPHGTPPYHRHASRGSVVHALRLADAGAGEGLPTASRLLLPLLSLPLLLFMRAAAIVMALRREGSFL